MVYCTTNRAPSLSEMGLEGVPSRHLPSCGVFSFFYMSKWFKQHYFILLVSLKELETASSSFF
jgi:hypothetical protein